MSILPDATPVPRPASLNDRWWPILVALMFWMLVPAAVLELKRATADYSTSGTTRAIGDYTPSEMAMMAISGPAAGLVALLVATWRREPGAFDRLGFSARKLARGVRRGALAALVVVPLMFGVMRGTQWLWERIRYRHPDEHELLKAMGESSSLAVRIALVLSAVVLAPIFEELMFRGYLQTALADTIARGLARRERPAEAGRPLWSAIVIASIAFTLVHGQLWLMPPIFFLSLCLGYLYASTGNLWAPIIVHAAFNAVSTILFLYFR